MIFLGKRKPLPSVLVGTGVHGDWDPSGCGLQAEPGGNLVSWHQQSEASLQSVFGRGDERTHQETMFKCFISLFLLVKLSVWLMAKRERACGRNGEKQRCFGDLEEETENAFVRSCGRMVSRTHTSQGSHLRTAAHGDTACLPPAPSLSPPCSLSCLPELRSLQFLP